MGFTMPEVCGRRRVIEAVFAAVALVGANAVMPIVAVAEGWAGTYGPLYGAVLPWVITFVQLAVTPFLLLGQHRWPTGAAMTGVGVSVAGFAAMATGPSELYAAYASITVWVPVALSSVVPGMLLRTSRRRAVLLWIVLGATTVLASRPWAPSLNTFANGVLHVAVPALIGLYLVARGRMLRALRDRADRAEREQHLLAEQARADERARLAAEMHDIVSHRVSLMVLQAGALRMNSTDDTTRAAAEELRATGCQALDELRDLVGVLRQPPAPGGAGEQPLPAPEPQTPDLAALAADGRAAGLDVTLHTDGDPGHVAPVVARTAHRVAREALTNAGKHALGAAVTIDVSHDPERLRLRICNTAPPGSGDARLRATGAGSGLTGLRQRVEVLGGAFTAGPDDDGGFTVQATLPLFVPASEPAPEPAGTPR